MIERWRRRRGVPPTVVVGSLAAALVVAGGGCYGAVGNTPRIPHDIQGRLAHLVAATVRSYGMPLDYGWVGCHGPDTTGTYTCYATTAQEPTGEITGTFALHRLTDGRCPGTLVVNYTIPHTSTVTVARVPIQPCTFGGASGGGGSRS